MLKSLLCIITIAGLAAAAAAEGLVTHRPDHVIFATIDSVPSRAEIWTASTNGEPTRLGQIPYVATVDLRWGTGIMLKKWHKLAVWTAGELCSASYDRTQKVWTITMRFEVRAPGFENQLVERELVSFGKPDDLDWDHITGIPTRLAISVDLQDAPAPGETAVGAGASRSPATVMLAGAAAGAAARFGTLQLDASVADAEVIVDGAPAGRTPVRLILREGEHDITVQKAGHRARQQRISVAADSNVRMKLDLEAATP